MTIRRTESSLESPFESPFESSSIIFDRHYCLVLQDSFGDYYYYYEFSQGGDRFIAKFWAPRGTCAEDFVKNYFKGAMKDVDMNRVLPRCESKYESLTNDLLKEQKELVKLHEQARDQFQCACRR
jgi:hypothetical protein